MDRLRLFLFDFLHGNRIGLTVLVEQHGLLRALELVTQLKWRLFWKNPFEQINKANPPNQKALLSQIQMAPLLVMYDLLKEKGYSEEVILKQLQELSDKVATGFLKFNIPVIEQSQYRNLAASEKSKLLKKLTERFFNASAESRLSDDDNFTFTVNHCYFAQYAKELDRAQLGPLFCQADKLFFEQYQKDIKFIRTVTLAADNQSCDFAFQWKDS